MNSVLMLLQEAFSESYKIKIAKAIVDTQSICEGSWINFRYNLSMEQKMIDKAVESNGLPDYFVSVISDLLSLYWNDSHDWAELILEKTERGNQK